MRRLFTRQPLNSFGMAIAGAALAAVAIRLWFLGPFASTPLFSQVAGGHDRALYHQAAQAVAAGAWWPDGSFAFLPLYPWVVGLLYAVVGPHLVAAAALGLLCDAATTALLVALARRLGASPKWAAAAGLLYACYPRAIVYSTLTMPTSLNILLVTALALALASETPRPRRGWVGLGLLAGVTGLGYPAVWPALLIFAALAGFGWIRVSLTRAHLPLFLAGALLPVLPVVIHNTRAEGQLTLLSTHGGINVYMGNHERATGYPLRIRDFRMTATDLLHDAHRAAETEVGHPLTRAQSSAWWSAQARTFIREHPGAALRLTLRKFRLFWSGTEVDDLRMVEQARLMNHQLTGPWWIPFGVFSALGLFGLLTIRGATPTRLLFWTCLAGVVSLFITTRYRLPLTPLLAAFGAAGLTTLARDLRARQRLPTHALALTVAAGLAAWPGGVPDVRATDYYNASVQWLAAGQTTKALDTARAGLALDPGFGDLYHAEGSALFKQEQFAQAAESFAKALHLRPRHPNARFNLALSHARAGQVEAALRALEDDPQPDARSRELAETLRKLRAP
jgi:hypothetical protein